MIAVGKNLVLMRQIGAARIDQIDAWQSVCRGDFLGAQMFLHGQRIIGAALYRRVIDDQHAVAPLYARDAGDDSGRRHFSAVKAVRRKGREFEQFGARIDKRLDALTRQHFAALRVARARFFTAAAAYLGQGRVETIDERLHRAGVFREFRRAGIDFALQLRHAENPPTAQRLPARVRE